MLALILLVIILLITLSIPAVQTRIAKSLTESLRENKNVNISIGKVSLDYTGSVRLDEVFIEDHKNDTLLVASTIKTSILGIPGLLNNSPKLGHTYINELDMRMRRYEGEEKDNLGILIDKLSTQSATSSEPFDLKASDVEIVNSRYSYHDENLENPDVVVIDSLSIIAEKLEIYESDVDLNIQRLRGYEHRGLDIKRLATRFHYDPNRMSLMNLDLETPLSKIDADLQFEYKTGDFSDFENLVQVNADFRESTVFSDDLIPFYDGFGKGERLELRSKLKGTLNDFILSDLVINGMDRSSVNGTVNIKGAFSKESNDFVLHGDFSELTTNYYDLVNLLPGPLYGTLPERIRDFGNLQLTGKTSVTNSSLDANVNISTQLGSAKADFVLNNYNNQKNAKYKGKIVARNLNIGRLVDRQDLGKASFDLDFDGTGLETEYINTQLQGKVSSLVFNNYTYNNIQIIGNLRNPVFNGYVMSRDPNLQMEFNGLADVSENVNLYDFEASVEYADLNKLNFVSRDSVSIFKGDVIMNIQGTNVNDATGEILLLNASYKNHNDLYYFADLNVTSSFEGLERTITINSSDVINGEVRGIFQVNEVDDLFRNSIGSIYTNYQPEKLTENQYMEFDFDIYNQIVEIFFPDIELAPNTFLRGRVESNESEFKLTFRSPRIDYAENMVQNVNLQVDNTNPIYNTFFEADSLSTDFYKFSEVSFINVTQNDTLYIRSEIKGGNSNSDFYNLNLYHTINEEGKSVVGIQKSDFKFKENIWYLNESENENNRIVFSTNFRELQIDSLVMSHENEQIRLRGRMNDTISKDFSMEFDNVDLAKITPDIDSLDLGGIVNGKLDLLQEKGLYYPDTQLLIENFKINNTTFGRMQLDVVGNEDLTNYNINAKISNSGLEALYANGYLDVSGSEPRIDLEVNMNRLNIAPFSPLGKDVISNIRGFASGRAFVTGNYRNPEFSGSLDLNRAGLRIPYLNVDLNFEDRARVDLTNQQFNFNNIKIIDTKYNTEGRLNGSISHQNFSEWFLDLELNSDRLLVLDTKASEDALYYGTAFIDGEATIKGPTDQLVIDVTASSERGTVFKIPLSDTEFVGDNSFIHFLTPEEKAARLAGEEIEIPEVKGLELVFDLDINNNAEVEVVVDQESGSTLRGRGSGNLLLEINTNGKFNMWGDFVVYEGVYNFKYAGLVQKVFSVESGGNINWNGDPTKAQLDVSAVYSLNANPAVLLENPSVNRKIPVDVVVNLQGDIEQPDISFDIDFPSASSTVKSELQYRINDRQSRELQALFLVTQGSFYSDFGLRGTAIYGTLAERASSIVNDIFADEDGKFQVGVNYVQGDRTPDQQTVDRFGLTLSTQISDRVIINGQVGVPIGGVTESVIIGDLEIDFLLNEDGSLRAKIFNRESNIQFIGEKIGFTQGAGLSYSVDFDTFKELIRKLSSIEVEGFKTQEEQVEETQSPAPDFINFEN